MESNLEKFKESTFYKGEEVISSIEVYIGKLMGFGNNTQFNGALILTRQQLIFYAEAIGEEPEVYERIPLNQILSTNIVGWVQKTLTVVSKSDVYDFKSLGSLQEIESFKQKISFTRDNMLATGKSEANSLKSKKSNIDMNKIEEIEKLKKLLDGGALSKEQYDLLLNDIIGDNINKLTKEEQLLADGAITQKQYDLLIGNTDSTGKINHKSDNDFININVQTGIQKWSRKNLSVKNYRSGKPIKQLVSADQISAMFNDQMDCEPHWMYLNFDPNTEKTHGLLYVCPNSLMYPNAVFHDEIAPEGYRIPNQQDILDLFNTYGRVKGNEYGSPIREINLKDSGCEPLLELFDPNQGMALDFYEDIDDVSHEKIRFIQNFSCWICKYDYNNPKTNSILISSLGKMKLFDGPANDIQWDFDRTHLTDEFIVISFLKCIKN